MLAEIAQYRALRHVEQVRWARYRPRPGHSWRVPAAIWACGEHSEAIAATEGEKKAIVAVERSILVIVWRLATKSPSSQPPERPRPVHRRHQY